MAVHLDARLLPAEDRCFQRSIKTRSTVDLRRAVVPAIQGRDHENRPLGQHDSSCYDEVGTFILNPSALIRPERAFLIILKRSK